MARWARSSSSTAMRRSTGTSCVRTSLRPVALQRRTGPTACSRRTWAHGRTVACTPFLGWPTPTSTWSSLVSAIFPTARRREWSTRLQRVATWRARAIRSPDSRYGPDCAMAQVTTHVTLNDGNFESGQIPTRDQDLRLAALQPSLTLDTRDNFFTPTRRLVRRPFRAPVSRSDRR